MFCSNCRKEGGYDGWRLDFARGFWGGYVKDYMEATEPYFAVGEYCDSLSYTYGEMDYNQDAHRQRIVDWINATNGCVMKHCLPAWLNHVLYIFTIFLQKDHVMLLMIEYFSLQSVLAIIFNARCRCKTIMMSVN